MAPATRAREPPCTIICHAPRTRDPACTAITTPARRREPLCTPADDADCAREPVRTADAGAKSTNGIAMNDVAFVARAVAEEPSGREVTCTRGG
ncbi:MAG: hypothetical protein O2973_01470 [Gemmatimonadetes bacterium]|nr:hypothetical protein [Gemmatimonadota bacterium]